jgi:lipopolysaccharide/colanic/teichoic acid biosynthesis glycosyltransferase
MNMNKHKRGFYETYLKRLFDFICSLLGLIILSPVMVIVAILVRVKLGAPVLFKQERPGLNGKIFKLYKFRSMSSAKDENGNLLPDDERLGTFGKLLRSTSLDELPELFNILSGQMSVIGPRPLLPRDVECMSPEQNRRHEVRPGLTGLAQCSGRNGLNWDTKLELDVEYVDNISIKMDCMIFLKTIYKVFKRENIEFTEENFMDLKDWNELKKKKEGI